MRLAGNPTATRSSLPGKTAKIDVTNVCRVSRAERMVVLQGLNSVRLDLVYAQGVEPAACSPIACPPAPAQISRDRRRPGVARGDTEQSWCEQRMRMHEAAARNNIIFQTLTRLGEREPVTREATAGLRPLIAYGTYHDQIKAALMSEITYSTKHGSPENPLRIGKF